MAPTGVRAQGSTGKGGGGGGEGGVGGGHISNAGGMLGVQLDAGGTQPHRLAFTPAGGGRRRGGVAAPPPRRDGQGAHHLQLLLLRLALRGPPLFSVGHCFGQVVRARLDEP